MATWKAMSTVNFWIDMLHLFFQLFLHQIKFFKLVRFELLARWHQQQSNIIQQGEKELFMRKVCKKIEPITKPLI